MLWLHNAHVLKLIRSCKWTNEWRTLCTRNGPKCIILNNGAKRRTRKVDIHTERLQSSYNTNIVINIDTSAYTILLQESATNCWGKPQLATSQNQCSETQCGSAAERKNNSTQNSAWKSYGNLQREHNFSDYNINKHTNTHTLTGWLNWWPRERIDRQNSNNNTIQVINT